MKRLLSYRTPDPPPPPNQRVDYACVLTAFLLPCAASAALFIGIVFAQDVLVDGVRDSHRLAWLYTAPLAGALSVIGIYLSVRVIRRRPRYWGFAVASLAFNAIPLAVFLLSLRDRRF